MAMPRNMRNLNELRAQMRANEEGGVPGAPGAPQQAMQGQPQQPQQQYAYPPQAGYPAVAGPTAQQPGPGTAMAPTPTEHSYPPAQAPSPGSMPPTANTTGTVPRRAPVTPGLPARRLTETERLESLLREVDPSFRISPGASEVVLHMIENFMDKVAERAAQVARHRSSGTIEQKDVAYVLLKDWNMSVPGVSRPPAVDARGVKRKGP